MNDLFFLLSKLSGTSMMHTVPLSLASLRPFHPAPGERVCNREPFYYRVISI
jgi:hypothetical protein